MKHFIVCSYGGSGSKMLCNYLKKFGRVYHVHTRNPPDKLTYVGKETYNEWFSKYEIPISELKNYHVIYIYKNPIKAVYSRFGSEHLKHIECNCDFDITQDQVADSGEDFYGIEEFFNNYTTPNKERNYKIYCVKYEDFFQNVAKFNEVLGLPDQPKLYPKEIVTKRNYSRYDDFYKIYKGLIERMEKMDFITII